ncbi:ribonuclease H-like domain-containing protein [Lipomyces tetrasporus]|uniref:Ribonuclease H-like domain-containing protein n=1 Tax=Lipomyces tetrasporus TaxID=54092 RepID=A0AAD7VUR6_9ASCO|nr:ribonuclease H-like domain-containing protein [Lipomyces tetrasporus]KAJ8101545.1 ribonuclease H-like domain-containing protein [Lipomyces tetrasporus]
MASTSSTSRTASDPDIEAYNASVFAAVLKMTQAASRLASQDLTYYRTASPDVTGAIERCSNRLLAITNSLLRAAGGKGTLKNVDELVEKWNKIGDVNDTLFEKTDTYLDMFTNQKSEKTSVVAVAPSMPQSQSLKRKRGRLDSSIANANVVRPQLKFERKPDNYDTSPFRPLLTEKPNAMKSLEESLQMEYPKNDGQPYYRNPYQYEIEHAKFPKSMKKPCRPVDPMPFEDTSAIWVDTPEKLRTMLKQLKNETEIAVDLEHHDNRSYIGFVCLLQISTRSQDYLVDTLVLRSELQVLNDVLTNPKIIKVFHGANSDIIWLQRDFGLYVVALFDTYHAAKVLNLEGKSLGYLLDIFCSFKASKEYQLADWRIRPLPQEMLNYARSDTHFLLNIYDQLRNKLLASGADKLESVLANSRKECKQRYVRVPYDHEYGSDPSGWKSLSEKWAVTEEIMPMLKAITQWRDKMARTYDDSLSYVLPNRAIFGLLKSKPINVPGVMGIIGKNISEAVKENVDELLKIIAANDPGVTRVDGVGESRTQETETDTEQNVTADLSINEEDAKEGEDVARRRTALAEELFSLSSPVIAAKSQFWGNIFDEVVKGK